MYTSLKIYLSAILQYLLWCLLLCLLLVSGTAHTSEKLHSEKLHSEKLHSEKVILQLKWLHQFQFAGYYAALEKGYFAEEGLDVYLQERNTELSNVDQVLQGEAHYGVTDSIVLLHYMQRKGVVLVAPIFQHSPNVLMTLRSSNIQQPKDLVGRRLAFYDNDTDGISLLALLADQGVLEQGLIRYSLQERMQRLIEGEVDAVAAYSTNEPYLLREMGHVVNIIDPKHYGLDFYGDVLFTTKQEAQNNPQRVAAMRRAVLRGWEYALDHKEELVDLILANYNTQNKSRKALMNEAQGLEPLIARHTTELGTLTLGRLEYMVNLLSKNNIIKNELSEQALTQDIHSFVFDSGHKELDLTKEEWDFIAAHPVIKVGIDRDWPPFEYLGKDSSELQGISHDYLKLLEKLLFLKFEIQDQLDWSQTIAAAEKGQLDLLPAITNTPERSRYLDFTASYIRSPMVIVTDHSVSFIADMDELNGKRIAVVKGYASNEMLSQHHPLIELSLKNNAVEALKAVAAGEVYAFIDNLAVVSYLIRTQGLANLKISGQTPYSFDLSMGIKKDNPQLTVILDKALQHISRQQHTIIYDRWMNMEVSQGFPWSRFLPPFLGLLAILLVLGGYTLYLFNLNRQIRQANCLLQQAELDLTQKNSQLERVSTTDKLTGAYNRHFLDKALSEQVALAQRHQRPMSIALFDLDFFKKVNDNLGHQMGDKVLQVFTDLVKQNIRASDIFGRWGGEEFLLICPETNQQQAGIVLEKIRARLEDYCFDADLKQTVSVGMVEVQSGLTVDQLLSLADQKLYLAKHTGRNKVVS